MAAENVKFQEDYKFGFKDEDTSIVKTGIGLSEEVVRQISKLKNEPEWMLEYRLKSFRAFQKMPMPDYGPDLSLLDFDSYTYFTRMANGESKNWDEVPETVKNTDGEYKIVGIKANAFKNSKKLKTVTIGKNVTSIDRKSVV